VLLAVAVPNITDTGVVTNTELIFSGGSNDWLAVFVGVLPDLFLIFVAICMLHFGYKLFRKFAARAA
jgi:hypothetical protein